MSGNSNSGPDRSEVAFVDRAEYIDAFEMARKQRVAREGPDVLVFYGMGGTGKTALSEVLERRCRSDSPRALVGRVTFTSGHGGPVEILFGLRNRLVRDYRVTFPSFDLAYAIYWEKEGQQGGKPWHRSWLVTEGRAELLVELAKLAGEVPLVGILPKLPGLLEKAGDAYRRWWAVKRDRDLMQILNESPPRILEYLPRLWAEDVAAFLQEHAAREPAFFLDNYEGLFESGFGNHVRTTRDAWIRQLVEHVPQALWVVTGRERLVWDETNERWGQKVQQLQLGALPDADAARLLEEYVADQEQRKSIVKVASGLPFYLRLFIDLSGALGTAQWPEDGGIGTQQMLFELFLKHLPPSAREVPALEVLSIPRTWGRELFEFLARGGHIPLAPHEFPILLRYSVVEPTTGPGGVTRYTNHPLLRTAVRTIHPELARSIDELLHVYYAAKAATLMSEGADEEAAHALEEAVYHVALCRPAEEVVAFLKVASKPLEERARWRGLVAVHETLVGTLKDQGPSLGLARALTTLSDLHYEAAQYFEGVEVGRAAAEMAESLGDSMILAEALAYAAISAEVIERWDEAEQYLTRVIEILRSSDAAQGETAAMALSSLSALRNHQARYQEALDAAEESLRIRLALFGPDHVNVAWSANDVGIACDWLGRSEEAERHWLWAHRIYSEAYGHAHPDVAMTENNLGVLALNLKRYAEAEKWFRGAVEAYTEALGPEHADLIYAIGGLAETLSESGRFDEALPVCEKALDMLGHTLGRNNGLGGYSLRTLGVTMAGLENHAKSITLLRQALEAWYTPDLEMSGEMPYALVDLAKVYRASGDGDSAISSIDCAVRMLEVAVGDDHTRTSEAKALRNDIAHGPKRVATEVAGIGGPHDPYEQLEEGRAALSSGDTDAAEALFLEALEGQICRQRDPQALTDIFVSLADVYERRGWLREARNSLLRAKGTAASLIGGSDEMAAEIQGQIVAVEAKGGWSTADSFTAA